MQLGAAVFLNQSTPRTLQSAAGKVARVHQKTHGVLWFCPCLMGPLWVASPPTKTPTGQCLPHIPDPISGNTSVACRRVLAIRKWWGWLGGYKWNSNLTSFPNSKECHVPGYKLEYMSHTTWGFISHDSMTAEDPLPRLVADQSCLRCWGNWNTQKKIQQTTVMFCHYIWCFDNDIYLVLHGKDHTYLYVIICLWVYFICISS